tara:strand:- start:306 stop:545 length:240 start_codon:yes stop_codon:yes gene_type:complete
MLKKYVNGKLVSLTDEEEKKFNDDAKKSKLEREKIQYSIDRKKAFPSFGDQLDYIFHHGLAKWKTDIVQPVKDKFPKPE